MAAVDLFQEKWEHVKSWVKERWGDKISDDELDRVAGQREQLCGLINEKCGVPRKSINRDIDNILSDTQMRSGF